MTAPGARRALAVAVRLVRQLRRDKRTLGLMFVVPVVMLGLVVYLLEGPSTPPVVAVVAPTERLSGWFSANVLEPEAAGTWKVIDRGTAAPDDVIREQDASAVLVVPGDLFSAPLRGKPPAFEVVVEGAEFQMTARILGDMRTLLPGIVSRLSATLRGPFNPGGEVTGGTGTSGQAGGLPAAPFSVRYVYGGPGMEMADYLAPALVGFLGFFFVFLLTATSFLRERQRGTLVRMATSPLRPAEVMVGYMAGFSLFALAQAGLVLAFVVGALRVAYRGNLGRVVFIELLVTLGASSLGVFLSAYARNELQVAQFIPMVIIPQALLGGLVVSVHVLPSLLQPLAYAMPLTYATSALTKVMIRGQGPEAFWPELLALVAFAAAFTMLGARSMRRA